MHVYPKNSLQKLDFPFILKELENLCSGSLGKALLQDLSFITNTDEVNKQLHFVKELKEIIENDTQLPQYGFNTLPFLEKLQIENYFLEVKELIAVYFSLSAAADVFRFFTPKARQLLYPFLSEKVAEYQIELGIIASITKVIDVDKEIIRDNATPELSKIRKDIQHKIQDINAVFRRVLSQYKQQNFLAETEETVRDGRRVLSVKAEYKRSIRGLITDESDNGSITFIEPNETLFLNNELTELYLLEKRELLKILISLTNYIRPHKTTLDKLQHLMADLDVIRAKAYFAINFNCNMPQLSNEPIIHLREFVHPVLFYHHQKQNKPIIDNAIFLDAKNRIVVISGPNAGGKSIVLKSIGLIQLMLQFGMLIPAKENSIVSIFENLFVDIGDEQSIENDLSTYSSHLSNMNYFLSHASCSTLVLIDEMGMGTDPALGGPMAEAILESLHQKQVFGVVTTHFNNLKVFAANTAGMQSGAMAFDTQQLKPLYQLQLGQPGSSFTFEIARKSGLPSKIIQQANLKIGDNKKALDDVLTDIQTEKHFIKGLRKNVQQKETQLQDLTNSYTQLNKDLEKEKKRLLKQYEARLLERFNAESRNLENEMREWKEQKDSKEKFITVRKFIDNNRESIERKLDDAPVEKSNINNKELIVGAKVKLLEGTEIGVILSLKNNTAVVAFGSMQSTVKLHQLQLIQESSKEVRISRNKFSSKILVEKSEFDNSLDIRGMLKDEAILALDNYMDRVVMYGIHQLKIIHGRGTGALKQAVHFYLKKYPHVKTFRVEAEQFGGDGITIVEMK
ncbi:MAG TPA: Smr/MutS family protein [Chitinophagales bacterium]|nr:Smr/MutS family protein [Chitinophagales bacterium]HMY23121.1 Smr/MutS family protein [Chitinophagales bacterium]HNF18019.1 Smr/MutS family protein [Chitinophagales bacterium]HNF50273.1 Smr/MutS family protein [Chitinophagales bacterium]HNJ00368.1 Smr/MutS family protein [Chitinophagales bacterium]